MKIAPFELERWYVQYEFNVKYNISASCGRETTTAELLAMAGPEGREKYLNLGLDYTQNPGDPLLRQELSKLYASLSPDQIQETTGASEAIFLLMNHLLEPGDTVIAEAPIYQSLFSVAEAVGAKMKRWQLHEEHGWQPDLDELTRLIDSRAKMVVINSPHSPTGSVLSPEIQRALVELAEKRGFWLISDEVYRGIVYDPQALLPPAVDLSERAISIGDMTKPYGLGGLRVGWIAAHDRSVLEACSSMRDYTTMCNSAPSEFLATVALQHRDEILARNLAIARENMALFASFVEKHRDRLSWVKPRGGFTAFPKYNQDAEGKRSETGKNILSSREFCRRLVEAENLLLLPGETFGLDGHFRVGFGQDPRKFAVGLKLFDRFLEK
ncbi:MAG: aminotransferase class I/II-fold pyridoxal phosphate-dependent enzyme [Firmicutes bacterium]|nr:aminotransferase class I/II-fold pyridoxal phosphate-dependent enzyme [Bacillota bacterium]